MLLLLLALDKTSERTFELSPCVRLSPDVRSFNDHTSTRKFPECDVKATFACADFKKETCANVATVYSDIFEKRDSFLAEL